MAANLRLGVFAAHSPDEGQESFLLRLGAGVARFSVDVAASGVDDGDGAVVHVMLRAVLAAMFVRTDALVRAVQMYEDVISRIYFSALGSYIRLELAGAVPGVEFCDGYFTARRGVRAVNHDCVDRCFS